MSTTTNHHLMSKALAAKVTMALGTLLLLILGATALPAQAQSTPSTTITVNTDADEENADGDCSLREAIEAANANQAVDACPAGSASGEDSIGFDLGSTPSTITLNQTLGELWVADASGLLIDGGEEADVTLSGNDAVRVFFVNEGAKLALKNLTVAHGNNEDPDSGGGGIFNWGGTLEVTDSTFSDNSSTGWSGGIHNAGALTVTGSTFSQNSAISGGGITNYGGTLEVTDSTFSQNSAPNRGGGISNELYGTLTVTGSTISQNSAGRTGGGIANGGALTLANSTISQNSAGRTGGGIVNGLLMEATNSTFYKNSASGSGGGIANYDTATLRNTIVASSTSGGNCTTPITDGDDTIEHPLSITDGGYNIEDTNTCGFDQANNSKPDTDPLLDPEGLQDNGGPTKTVALQATSPAIDSVPEGTNGCATDITTDQRGEARPYGAACDAGAFELANSAPVAENDSFSTPEDTALDISVLANDTDPDPGDTLSVHIVSNPANGRLTENPDGTLKYTPNPDFNGTDSFAYKASDGELDSAVATVTIRVNAVNDPPVAKDDSANTDEDKAIAGIDVVGNDTDIEGDKLIVSGFDATSAEGGKVTMNEDGTFKYEPKADFSGTDTFTYKATDGSTDSNPATVSITVGAVNDAPTVAVAAGGQCGASGTTGTINLTVGDVESAAGALTLSATSFNQQLVPNSSISSGGSGAGRTLTVGAQPKRSGTATITLTVSDGDKTSSMPITVKVGTDASETLTGTSGADMIFGKNGNDTINALDGNDLICGSNGAGTMSGGSGDDTLDGAKGNDVLRGDEGRDILRGGQGDDMVTGGASADSFSGGSGIDVATDFNAGEGDTGDGTIP
jgi:CSLREA domain-containing protein